MPPPPLIDAKRSFVKLFEQLAHHKQRHTVFEDFLDLATLAIRKTTVPPDKGETIEQAYMETVKRNQVEDVQRMPELLALTQIGLLEGGEDFLGPIFSELGFGDKHLSQFFTPWNVGEMMARITIQRSFIEAQVAERGFLSLCEPAVGAGALVLAAAKVFRDEGFDPKKHLFVVASDISPVCFKMTYLQLTIAGIPALVRRGDSLADVYTDRAITPAFFPFHELNRVAFDKWWTEPVAVVKAAEPELSPEQIIPSKSDIAKGDKPSRSPAKKTPNKAQQYSLF